MTIQSNGVRITYTATSGQTVFPYPFEAFEEDDLTVEQNGTTLSLNTEYTVSGVGNDSGGNVTLVTGATLSDTIRIKRVTDRTRESDYADGGDFLASQLNDDFDRLWAVLQEQDIDLARAIRKPDEDADSVDMELGLASARADKALGFDSNGQPDVTTSTRAEIDSAVTAINTIAGASAGSSASISHISDLANAVATTVQAKLRESISVLDFGADPTGTTDSTTAIQNAIDTGRDIYFPKGKYLTTATITSDTEGQALVGVGGNGNDASARTEIECSATSGAVIRYKKRSFTMQGFKISSSAGRYSATTTTGHGIWGEAEDAVLTQSSRPALKDIWIVEQPSTGVYLGGGHEHGLLDTVVVQDCKYHGFVFDDGTYSGRTNTDVAPFEVEVNRCRAFECGGNACLVGFVGDSDITRLMRFVQFEALGCAWDSSNRISHHQIIDRGIQITWDMVDIEDQQYGNATTSGGNSRTALANPSAGVDSYRDYSEFKYPYFSSLTESINLNSGGNGIRVINPNIATGTYGVAQANAIVIPNTVEDFYGEFNSSRITGATDVIQNQSEKSEYKIDGEIYQGFNNTTFDLKISKGSIVGTIASGTLEVTHTKVALVGEGDTTDTLNRIRYASGLNGREGDEMTLIFGGTVETGAITAFADAGGGQVTVTSNTHNLAENEGVIITGTTNYNGTFTATNVTANTFEITDTWVADDATGTFTQNYVITINDVATGGTNIRTRDALAISMTETTRSVVRFVCNANLEWVEV